MYSSHTESEYLSYSTNLLLEKTSKSPDYNRLVYENPLSECTFVDYNLSADWRRRHEIMTPLFVDTLNSLPQELEMFGTSSSFSANNLRATQQQTLQFQATQDISGSSQTNKKMPYNWLTQSNVDTLNDSMSFGTFSETQSTLLFNTSKKKVQNFGNAPETIGSGDQDILRLRRRFLKDKTTDQTRFYARKQVTIQFLLHLRWTIRFC